MISNNTIFLFSALPDEGPRITGGRPRYQIGDIVKVNCTSGRSKPSPHLNWFINGEPSDRQFLRHYPPIMSGREGLETSTLGLEFRVKQKYFKHGDMKLKVRHFLSSCNNLNIFNKFIYLILTVLGKNSNSILENK